MDSPQQHDEGGKNSGKTRHDSAPCVLAGALFARRNQAWVGLKGAMGGSAVPAIPTAYGQSEYRQLADNSRLADEVK
jgi:hypothetical protein